MLRHGVVKLIVLAFPSKASFSRFHRFTKRTIRILWFFQYLHFPFRDRRNGRSVIIIPLYFVDSFICTLPDYEYDTLTTFLGGGAVKQQTGLLLFTAVHNGSCPGAVSSKLSLQLKSIILSRQHLHGSQYRNPRFVEC